MRTRPAAARKKTKTVPETPQKGWTRFAKQSVILGVLLAVATFVVYLPVDHHPFVNYDDVVYVVNNPHIQSGLDWDTISWAFTTFYQFNWHPLTWISHAIDVQMFQLEPAGHHVTNMLLQIVNALLLYWVLMRATGYVGRSAMVAGLFALHPVNVESVAWVSERKNLLSMMFFLLGLGAYRWYAATDSAARDGAKHAGKVQSPLGRYILMALLFAMGLMSKPQIITFPFILLLWDYWPLQRVALRYSPFAIRQRHAPGLPAERQLAKDEQRFVGEERKAKSEKRFLWLVKEKLPLFALCAASAVVTVMAQKHGGAVVSLETYPFSIRLTNAIVAYVRYIGKCFWPTNLIPIYPHPWHVLPMVQVIPALVLLLGITALTVAARGHRYLLVGWLWFLGALVPMIGLVHVGNQAMADRYAYLPFIGLFIMICWGVAEFAEWRQIPVTVLRTAGAIVLVILAVLTHHQLAYWNDNITLWTHAINSSTDNYVAHDNLALLLIERGQADEAMKHFHAALAIYPSDPTSNLQIAIYDHQQGRLQDAIARYDQMISQTPDGAGRAELLANRGLVYVDLKDGEHAKGSFERAIAMDPNNYRAWIGLGVLAVRSGDLNLAIQNFQRATTSKPTELSYTLLAKALDQAGRTSEAQAARERAKLLSGRKGAQAPAEGLLAY